MRHIIARLGAVLVIVATVLAGLPARPAVAQDGCLTWSEARRSGLTKKLNLRPAKEIKASVESRYKGKVVSFVICQGGAGVSYNLVVFRADGGVINVKEPAQ